MGRYPLTRKQQALYEYLQRLEASGVPAPTLDELCEGLALRSRGSLHKHVRGLIEAGLVEDNGGRQRGVRLARAVPELEPDTASLPMLGKIAAGQPIEAIESPEVIEVPPLLRSHKPCFALKVRGDSMMEDGILDGDVVIVEQREFAKNGEIVVALVDGEDATLKRIVQRPGEIELWPANSQMDVMRYPPERVAIQGAVVGQMRSYRN